MHQDNIETIRQEAIRILKLQEKLLSELLSDPQGILTGAVKGETQSFDLESTPKAIEALRGERKKLESLEMVLAVVGTMKAGKSTTINAIVGTEVLPNRNTPMTALPTLIRHTPGQKEPRLVLNNHDPLNQLIAGLRERIQHPTGETSMLLKEIETSDRDMHDLIERVQAGKPFQVEYSGAPEIFDFLLAVNDLVRLAPILGQDFPFADYNEVHELPAIEVEFAHLSGMQNSLGRLTLLDTPGPNEAGQHHLRDMLRDQLQKASAVLAVLDYTQLRSVADEQVRDELATIAEISTEHVFAIVNKFDESNNRGMNEKEVNTFVHALMKKLIKTENIFAVSSKLADLANRARHELNLHGALPDATKHPWVEDFGKDGIGPRWKSKIGDPQEARGAADWLWEESHFDALLNGVIHVAHANAATLALSAAANKLDGFSEKLGKQIRVRETALSKSAKEIKNLIDEIQSDIDAISKTERSAKSEAKKVLNRLEGMVQKGVQDAKSNANEEIDRYFKEGNRINYEKEMEVLEWEARERRESRSALVAKLNAIFSRDTGSEDQGKSNKARKVRDFDEGSTTIEFSDPKEAKDLILRIKRAIDGLLRVTNKTIVKTIEKEIASFQQEFSLAVIQQSQEALGSINHHLAEGGFEFSLKLPKLRNMRLEITAEGMLGEVVQKRQGKATRYSEQSNWKGGGIKRWLGEIFDQYSWGYDEREVDVEYSVVSLPEIKAAVTKGLKESMKRLDAGFSEQIEGPMSAAIDEFFDEFKGSVENIRGDLLQSLREKTKSEEEQRKLIEPLKKQRKKADNCNKDSQTLLTDIRRITRETET